MSGYTPGPWAAPKGFPSEVERQDGKTVASCWHENATLIASAPELLEALKAMVDVYGWFQHSSRADGPAVSLAKAAIAKAEGRT